MYMSLPEHVKKLALEAVRKDGWAQIQLHRINDASLPDSTVEGRATAEAQGMIPDSVVQKAKDAIAHNETVAQIRMMKTSGSVVPLATPRPETGQIAQRIAE